MAYVYEELRSRLSYEEIQNLDFGVLETGEAVGRLAQLIDDAFDRQDIDLLEQGTQISDSLFKRPDLSATQRGDLDYYVANCWNYRRRLETPSGKAIESSSGVIEEIFHLRRAVNSETFYEVTRGRAVQTLTNLGNALSNIGRTAEALEYWRSADTLVGEFGMAAGNLGYGLYLYAVDLQDPHQLVLFLREARTCLARALHLPLEGSARQFLEGAQKDVNRVLHERDDDHIVIPEPVSVRSDEDEEYRIWAAAHQLFLNPLNDLLGGLRVARDDLHAPRILVPVDEGPGYLGFLSQIKQEYVSARYFAFRGTHLIGPHHSDYEVAVADTLDYPSFSVSTEYSKASFRSAYSLFDKVAFFLNAYFNLRIPLHRVTFRNVWFDSYGSDSVRPAFRMSLNRMITALYWLSRDLYEKSDQFQTVMDPAAQELARTRNNLEHRYLKLHLEDLSDTGAGWGKDNLAHSMARSDFEERLLRLLRIARCAIVYLCLGVMREEHMRDQDEDRRSAISMKAPLLPDEWKL